MTAREADTPWNSRRLARLDEAHRALFVEELASRIDAAYEAVSSMPGVPGVTARPRSALARAAALGPALEASLAGVSFVIEEFHKAQAMQRREQAQEAEEKANEERARAKLVPSCPSCGAKSAEACIDPKTGEPWEWVHRQRVLAAFPAARASPAAPGAPLASPAPAQPIPEPPASAARSGPPSAPSGLPSSRRPGAPSPASVTWASTPSTASASATQPAHLDGDAVGPDFYADVAPAPPNAAPSAPSPHPPKLAAPEPQVLLIVTEHVQPAGAPYLEGLGIRFAPVKPGYEPRWHAVLASAEAHRVSKMLAQRKVKYRLDVV